MIRIEQSKDLNDDDIKVLAKGLDTNAKQKRGQDPVEFYAFFMRDELNNIVGGISGFMYYGCLYLDQLWIDEKYRGQNFGSKLVNAAEAMAREKACTFSTTETMDWEAKDFYERLGYYLESEQHGYHNGAVMYRMRKDW